MSPRVKTAWILITVLALPVLLGKLWLEVLSVLAILCAALEWKRAHPRHRLWPNYLPAMMTATVLIGRWIPLAYEDSYFILIMMMFMVLTIFAEGLNVLEAYYLLIFFFFFSFAYRGMGFMAWHLPYLWIVIIATYVSDTGAWFVGIHFGKHKMNPRLSPKKSWEGFFGGWLLGTLASGLLIFILPVSHLWGLILCLTCPVLAELGDLAMSAIKRQFKIKDFSNLLPGHGGVLDRIDSLLMNAVWVACLLPWL